MYRLKPKLRKISPECKESSHLSVFNKAHQISLFDTKRDNSTNSKPSKPKNTFELTFEDRKRFTSHKQTVNSINSIDKSKNLLPQETCKVPIKAGIMKMRNSRFINEEMYKLIKGKIMVPVYEKERKLRFHRRTSSKLKVISVKSFSKTNIEPIDNDEKGMGNLTKVEIMKLIRERRDECFKIMMAI